MEIGDVLGLAVGGLGAILGLGAAVYAVIHTMGYFEYLGGKNSNPNAVDRQTLLNRLLALNDPSKPYHIIEGEDTDLVAEWKILEASWYGIFNKSDLKEWYRASLFIDETRHAVRCLEERGAIRWTAGAKGLMPVLEYEKSGFQGTILYQKSWAIGYGIKDWGNLEVGKIYEYGFNVNDIRKPVLTAVEESGWEFVPVRARTHTKFKSLMRGSCV